ncbi:1900_t:CDS:2 [Ambispora gerdemannii]|uniref:1900_t:CDS:1 n=1 Tax=Ambispora gerdemannii TaxID=144530 RepID=A0A9N8YTJ6_9GLOM|nr:1900_t:CDS:2 [Ambispora gerdemannii]
MESSDKRCTVVDEDDDLDDLLDDVLENFSNVSVSSSSKANSLNNSSTNNPPTNNASTSNASTSNASTSNASPDLENSLNGLEDEEYAQQFTAEMEALVKKLGDPEELRQTFEAFLKNDLTESTEATSDSSSGNNKKSFQETINQTINKLQKSSDQVDAEVTEEEVNEEFLAEMMRQMEGLPYNGDIQDMFEKVMEQLTSRDILYEPMKHLATKYPEWLRDNKDKVSQEEYERYKGQSDYVQKIVAYFEAPTYSENNEQQNKELVDLMQKLQDFGQPPAGVLADLAPDLELDEQGLPKFLPADMDKCSIM